MPRINFSDYLYFPELTSTWPEKTGYVNLEESDKDKMLLTYLLSQVDNNSPDFNTAIANLNECAQGRPFILDLSKQLAPSAYEPRSGFADARAQERFNREAAIKQSYDAALNNLLNPTNGFLAWRTLVQQWDNAIPVLQFSNPHLQARSVLRQAAQFAAAERSFALRITNASLDDLIPVVSNIFAVVDRPQHVLFILDMMQSRIQVPERESFVTDAIAQISALVGERDRSRLRFVCTGGSFPKSTPAGLHSRDIHERIIWDSLSQGMDIRYGDYGSMLRLVPETTFRPADFRAAITLPMHTSWWCWRSTDLNNTSEWQVGARLIREHEDFDSGPECWGKDMVRRAAEGDTDGIESNRHWIAAKINLHLKRQIDYSEEIDALSGDI